MKKVIMFVLFTVIAFSHSKLQAHGGDAAVGAFAGLGAGLLIGNAMSQDGKREAREADEKAERAEEKAERAQSQGSKSNRENRANTERT